MRLRTFAGLALAAVLLFICYHVARGQAPKAVPSASASPATVKAADEAFRAGSEAFGRNDLTGAHREFQKLVRLAPSIAAGHAAFGVVLLAQGDARGAVTELQAALSLAPDDTQSMLNLALAYAQLKEPARSVAIFKRLPPAKDGAPEPLPPSAAVTYAGALEATGDIAGAQQQIELALKSSPDEASLHDALGSVLAQQQRYDEATSEFGRAIILDSTFAAAHYHLGSLLLNEHQPGAAATELKQAVALSRDNPGYLLQLGRSLSANGEDEAAAAALRSSLLLEPASIDVKYALALALQAGGDNMTALPLFREVAAARPNDGEVLTNQALALVQTGDASQAIALYLRALALEDKLPASKSRSATLRQDLGVAYLQQGDFDHALEQFRAGLALEADNPQLHYDLGLALKLKDNLVAAIPEFEQAEKLDPQLPDPPYTLGVLYMQQGRFVESQQELEKATILRPANGPAWELLGNVSKQLEQPEKAIDALRRAIALLPYQPSPHITLAAILAQQGDREGAAAERKQAAELSKIAVSRQRANFALDSAKLLLKRGQLEEAMTQFQAAVAADPTYAEAHLALADLLTRLGHAAEATAERQKAQQLAPLPHRP